MAFPYSTYGRHLLTARPRHLSITNVHAESGADAVERDHREKQLQYMSRSHEAEQGRACVLAGNFDMRSGEESWLELEGWHEVLVPECQWTWRRGGHHGRFDRVYVRDGEVECQHAGVMRSIWPTLSDHVALHVVLRLRCHSNVDSGSAESITMGPSRCSAVPSECSVLSGECTPALGQHSAPPSRPRAFEGDAFASCSKRSASSCETFSTQAASATLAIQQTANHIVKIALAAVAFARRFAELSGATRALFYCYCYCQGALLLLLLRF